MLKVSDVNKLITFEMFDTDSKLNTIYEEILKIKKNTKKTKKDPNQEIRQDLHKFIDDYFDNPHYAPIFSKEVLPIFYKKYGRDVRERIDKFIDDFQQAKNL